MRTDPAGTKVMLKIGYGEQEIVAFGKLVCGRQDIGMGIAFTIVGPHGQNFVRIDLLSKSPLTVSMLFSSTPSNSDEWMSGKRPRLGSFFYRNSIS